MSGQFALADCLLPVLAQCLFRIRLFFRVSLSVLSHLLQLVANQFPAAVRVCFVAELQECVT